MRKLLVILLALLVVGISFAQDETEEDLSHLTIEERIALLEQAAKAEKAKGQFVISGEAKTGVIWKEVTNRLPGGLTKEDKDREGIGVRMGSMDDAGSNDGRFRLNIKYTNSTGIIGFQSRLNWELFNNGPVNGPTWSYAYGWGSFFNNQFVLSLGKLGASPWGTGGPEMWKELEVSNFAGLRFEWVPKFANKWANGVLNLGLVLNWIDDVRDAGLDRDANILDLLGETVFGWSYKTDYFLIRGALRLDSPMDQGAARSGLDIENEGMKMVYRVEEFALAKLTPKVKVKLWAIGEIIGMGSESPEDTFSTRNWFFAQINPYDFLAQVRVGFEMSGSKMHMFVRPFFSYTFFKGLLVPSFEMTYANDFGDNKIWKDSAYLYIDFKPRLQVNFAQGAYFAVEYYYKMEMAYPYPGPPEKFSQWFNLRAGISF